VQTLNCLPIRSIVILVLFCTAACSWAQGTHPEWRGLLASLQFQGQPVKGVYFFPGEGDNSRPVYTAHPTLSDDLHWNSAPESRTRVMSRIAAAHVNTVVMSYWSNMPQWSPMALTVKDGLSVPGVVEAVQNLPLVVMPAIESGFDPSHPQIPHFNFQNDFPHPQGSGTLAPGLIQRIGWLVQMFRNDMNRWAQIYDLNGEARYAINILHACSDQEGLNDAAFASGFGAVAAQIEVQYRIKVGFTLDTIGSGCRYIAFPARAGAALKAQPAVLAVMGFESEVFSGKLVPHDNNRSNLPNLAAWKRAALNDWVATGMPIILDVSNGYDGHLVFADSSGSFWGDNLGGTDDRWRNWMSELKNPGVKGIVMDTWNGYTEGYAAVPTREHGVTVYDWLTDLLEPDPRVCSHMHYVNGVRTFRVYGAICDKWVQLGGDLGYGRPLSNEEPTQYGRRSTFADGKGIYWSAATNAHELHGLIYQAYIQHGSDGGCLGLPVSDEEANGSGGRINRFQHGTITWKQGDRAAAIHCH
jgi:hypothetical protein